MWMGKGLLIMKHRLWRDNSNNGIERFMRIISVILFELYSKQSATVCTILVECIMRNIPVKF